MKCRRRDYVSVKENLCLFAQRPAKVSRKIVNFTRSRLSPINVCILCLMSTVTALRRRWLLNTHNNQSNQTINGYSTISFHEHANKIWRLGYAGPAPVCLWISPLGGKDYPYYFCCRSHSIRLCESFVVDYWQVVSK